MQEIWYYEVRMLPDSSLIREKFLMVIDDDHYAKMKFNLTQMGLEHVNTFEELKEIIGDKEAYSYEKLKEY